LIIELAVQMALDELKTKKENSSIAKKVVSKYSFFP